MATAATLPAVAGLRADHHRPAPTASTIDGLPVYANGGQLVTHGSGTYGSGGVSLTATAGDLGLLIMNRCPAFSTDLEIDLQIVADGRYHGMMSCGTGGSYALYSPAFYPNWHVTPGQPVTLVFTPKAFRLTLDASGQTTGRRRPPDDRGTQGRL